MFAINYTIFNDWKRVSKNGFTNLLFFWPGWRLLKTCFHEWKARKGYPFNSPPPPPPPPPLIFSSNSCLESKLLQCCQICHQSFLVCNSISICKGIFMLLGHRHLIIINIKHQRVRVWGIFEASLCQNFAIHIFFYKNHVFSPRLDDS